MSFGTTRKTEIPKSPCRDCTDWSYCDGFSECSLCPKWVEWYGLIQERKNDEDSKKSR